MEDERIIQISVSPGCEVDRTAYEPAVFGLTNHGNLFIKKHGSSKWQLAAFGIPPPTIKKEKD